MTTERPPMFCEACRAVTTFVLTYSDTERTPARPDPLCPAGSVRPKGHTPILRRAFEWSWDQ